MAFLNEDNEDKKDSILELVILVPHLGGARLLGRAGKDAAIF